jgi:hypothetical protein
MLIVILREIVGNPQIATWTICRLIVQLTAQQLQGKESSPSVPESLKQ